MNWHAHARGQRRTSADLGLGRRWGWGARRTVAGAGLAALVVALGGLTVPSNGSVPEPTPSTQIAGGYFPAADAWPWVTALVDPTKPAYSGDFGRGFCTGTLIAPDRVLTAAHCVVGADGKTPRPANTIQALVGRRDLTLVTQGERRNVTGVAVHPKVYLPKTGVHTYHAFYDIAVLFLDAPVTTIPPATLGSPTDWNTWATTMGFGHFNYDHNNPQYDQYLRAADYDLLTDAQCASWFDDTTQHYYPEIHVCANNAPGGNVDCITHGDSGGPLMVQFADGSWRLIGVTSFYPQSRSDRCGAGGPFGFAWVAGPAMHDWPLTVPHPAGGAAPPAALDVRMYRNQLGGYALYMIREHTNGQPRAVRMTCSRTSDASFRCRLSWHNSRFNYLGRAKFLHFIENSQVYWDYSFRGLRDRRGCASCAPKRLRW